MTPGMPDKPAAVDPALIAVLVACALAWITVFAMYLR